MTTWGLKTGIGAPARWAAVAALASACAMGLAACEENSPPPAAEPATAAPAQGPANLMGAPEGAPPPAVQPSPPVEGAPLPGPPPGAVPPPPGPPPYPPGVVPAPQPPPPPGVPSEVIAMAPIPNPPEGPSHRHHWRVWTHGRRHSWWGPVFAAAPAPHRHRHHRHTAGVPAAPGAAHGPAAPAAQVPAPQLPKPKPPRHAGTRPDEGTVAAASGGAATAGNAAENAAGNAESNATGPAAATDRRYDALQSALVTLFARSAVLNAPKHMQPGVASDVTLTVSGDFAQALRTEAAKQNLSDQAASANLQAILAGDGYAIVPGEQQSLPLTLGAPTVFHWKVTPQGASQGPLHADVSVFLLGSDHPLALGAVKAGGGSAGRLIGVGLLVLIALVLLGWVIRSQRRPGPSGATRPRPNHRTNDEAPL